MPMAHIRKINRNATSQLLNHYQRIGENHTNEKIDKSKSHLNYNLAIHQNENEHEFLNKKLKELKCLNRANVNSLCSWAVTVPKDLDLEYHEQFFQETYNFLIDRYDAKNHVVSAWVHLDETSPHIHFAFIPAIYDQKKERFKVSAKELITIIDLKSFHSDLTNHLEQALGVPVNVQNEATKEGNKSIAELKRKSAIERLKEIEEIKQDTIEETKKEVAKIKASVEPIQAEYIAKKEFVKQLDDVSALSVMYPPEVKLTTKKVKTGKLKSKEIEIVEVPKELWEARHIAVSEKRLIEDLEKRFTQKLEQIQETTEYQNVKRLEQEGSRLVDRIINLKQEVKELKEENKELNDVMGWLIATIKAFIKLVANLFKSKNLDKQEKEGITDILSKVIEVDILTIKEVNDIAGTEILEDDQEINHTEDKEMSM